MSHATTNPDTAKTPDRVGDIGLFSITHKEAVRRVAVWLRNGAKFRCSVVMAELKTQNAETPDVLGFHGAGGSVLIECKVSRADFLADKQKHFRRLEDMGMGDVRYYAAPVGMLSPDELPEGWGLLELYERVIRHTKEPTRKTADKRCEVKMLMSVLRRLEISTAVFVRTDEENDAAGARQTNPKL